VSAPRWWEFFFSLPARIYRQQIRDVQMGKALISSKARFHPPPLLFVIYSAVAFFRVFLRSSLPPWNEKRNS